MYNISLTDLTERPQDRLEWHSESQDVQLCIMKGLDEVTRAARSGIISHTDTYCMVLRSGMPVRGRPRDSGSPS